MYLFAKYLRDVLNALRDFLRMRCINGHFTLLYSAHSNTPFLLNWPTFPPELLHVDWISNRESLVIAAAGFLVFAAVYAGS